MIKWNISLATAILILVAINTIWLGYLNSRVAYDANLAEVTTRQHVAAMNQTLQLVKESHTIIGGLKTILANQIIVISRTLNASTDAQRIATVTMLNQLQQLQDFFVAQQKQQSAQLQANSLPTPQFSANHSFIVPRNNTGTK